jgi:hypothetical protein
VTVAEEIEQSAPPTHHCLSVREAAFLALPFLFLTLVLFSAILFSGGQIAATHAGGDVTSQFRYWTQFGFANLRQGHLPLWNPHAYSGYPFFGNWQTALLYPFNWLNLFLPWYSAISWVVAIHFFLMGWFTSLWCRYRMVSPIGATLGGLIAVGGGGYFLHIYAGHIPFVCAAAWSPIILLCADGMIRQRSWWWVRLGVFALAMQILAGFPQVVYYTALMTGVYTLIQLPRCKHPLFPIVGFLIIAVAACGIDAVQLAVGLETASQSVRAGGANISLAASYSLAPENLPTIIMPHYLGDMSEYHPYFGRWFLWETCLFVGCGGLCLGLFGMFDRKNPGAPIAMFMCILAGVLAVGSYTTLYPFLYKYIPLYGSFRVNGRFGFFFTLFMGMLAGFGYDRLHRSPTQRPWLGLFFAAPGLLAILFSVWMSYHPAINAQIWDAALDRLWATRQTILPKRVHIDPKYREAVPIYSNLQILITGATLSLIGGLVVLAARRRWAVIVLAVAAAVEILAFDIHQLEGQRADIPAPPTWQAALADVPTGERVCLPSLIFANSGAADGHDDIWGYDPFMPRRYSEFMAMTQGENPDTAGYELGMHKISPLLRMVRLGVYMNKEDQPATHLQGALPQALIVYQWKLTPSRSQAFADMQAPSFDPAKTVTLETPPSPPPDQSGGGATVQISPQTSDSMEISVNLPKPGILLITDAYAPGWRAYGHGPADQPEYKILPADWCLRAIPLSAGVHNLKVVYEPASFYWGLPITLTALPLFALWCILPLAPIGGRPRAGHSFMQSA